MKRKIDFLIVALFAVVLFASCERKVIMKAQSRLLLNS